MKKKVCLLFLFFLTIVVFSDQVIDTWIFRFDRKVDNTFLSAYTANPDYFNNFYAMDVAAYREGGYYYGVGVDKDKNAAYYFDVQLHTAFFGIDQDTGERYFQLIDKVAVTQSGRIYIVDALTEEIAYWNISAPGVQPEGSLPYTFADLEDIYCDAGDYLYILDTGAGRIYKYSTTAGNFEPFAPGRDSLAYGQVVSSTWGRARGLVVTGNFIYLVFEHSALVKLDQEGNLAGSFVVSNSSLGLWPRSTKELSASWLESIALGPFGNLYILDSKAQKVHVFNTALQYICSWEDPGHPVEVSATDICFSPSAEYFFICHPWGFYSYTIAPRLAGVRLDRDVIYPELVSGPYRGVGIDLACIGSGSLDLVLTGQGETVRLIEQQPLGFNASFHYDWQGNDSDGTGLPPGEYSLGFYLDDELSRELPVTIKQAPRLEIDTPGGLSITTPAGSLTYFYRVLDPGHLTITLSAAGDETRRTLLSQYVTPGEYTRLIRRYNGNEYLGNGVYTLDFLLQPPELYAYNVSGTKGSRTFTVDSGPLTISGMRNNATGFSPHHPLLDRIAGAFMLSAAAHVTITVLDDNAGVVYTIMEDNLLSAGEFRFQWDGHDAVGVLLPDGRYRFRVLASQDFSGAHASTEGEYFLLDSRPPVVTARDVVTGSDPGPYYISPVEPSSGGIRDNLELVIRCPENARLVCRLQDDTGAAVIHPRGYTLEAEDPGFYTWDGMQDGLPAADGTYRLLIEAVDGCGNRSEQELAVVVDNNRLPEVPEHDTLMISGSFTVDTATDHLADTCLPLEEGFVLIWEAPGGNLSNLCYDIFDSAGGSDGMISIINTSVGKYNSFPSVARTDSGFFVTWLSGNLSEYRNLYLRQFSSEGSEFGGSISLKQVGYGGSDNSRFSGAPVGTGLDEGFLVAWPWYRDDLLMNSYFIHAQQYNGAGEPVGNEIEIAGDELFSNTQKELDAVINSGSKIIFIWRETGKGFFIRDFYPSENLLGPVYILHSFLDTAWPVTDIQCVVSGSQIGIFWRQKEEGEDVVYAMICNTSAQLVRPAFPVLRFIPLQQFNMTLLASGEGGFYLAWLEQDLPGNPVSAYVQLLDAGGNPRGARLPVIPVPDDPGEFRTILSLDHSLLMLSAADSMLGRIVEPFTVYRTGNLYARFLQPAGTVCTEYDLPVTAFVSDQNLDYYTVYLSDSGGNTTLLKRDTAPVEGDLCLLDITSLVIAQPYTITLEAFDKAGNHTADCLEVIRVDPEEVSVSMGDVNLDGRINIVDALMTAQYYIGLPVPGFYQAVADVNNNGTIDIVDALLIAQYSVGLLSSFPAS